MTLVRPHILSKKQKLWYAMPFRPSDINSVLMWLDDPAISGNVIESALRVSEWTGEVEGVNADQTTGADQGLRAGSEIAFDGSNEFMALADLFAVASGDTQGEIFMVLKTGADGVNGREFSASDDASDNNNFLLFIAGTPVAGEHRIQFSFNDGGTTHTIRGDTDIGENTLALLNFSSNDLRWRIGLNGSEETFSQVAGANNGKWVGDIAGVDNISLASLQRLNPLFGEGRLYSIVYSNVELSSTSRTLINNFLNSASRSWGPIY